jgi:hypothetical protein
MFTAQVVRSVAAAAQVPDSWVLVSNLRAGSVVADVSIQHPPGTSSETLAASGAVITSDPDSVFQSVKVAFNISAPVRAVVTAVQQPSSAGKPSSAGQPSVGIGKAVGAAVGGLVVLAAAAAATLWARRRRASVQEDARVPLEAATPVVAMHPSAASNVHAAAWPPGMQAGFDSGRASARPHIRSVAAAQPRGRRVAAPAEAVGVPPGHWMEQHLQMEEWDAASALPGVPHPQQPVRTAAGLQGRGRTNQAVWHEGGVS